MPHMRLALEVSRAGVSKEILIMSIVFDRSILERVAAVLTPAYKILKVLVDLYVLVRSVH